MTLKIENRFWEKVDRSGGPNSCWPWLAAKTKGGYGYFKTGSVMVGAHVFAYALLNGPGPNGLYTLHSCDNRPCCNPKHLFLGSHAQNQTDKLSKGRQSKGVGRPQSKLSDEIVRGIRSRYKPRDPVDGGSALAAEFGVHPAVVSFVVNGKTWAHVK